MSTSLKVYVAGSWQNSVHLNQLGQMLEEHFEGTLTVVSNWHRCKEDYSTRASCFQCVANDIHDMIMADICVATFPYGIGTSAEAGWFLGRNKPVFWLIGESQWEQMELPHISMVADPNRIFHTHEDLILGINRYCQSWSDNPVN